MNCGLDTSANSLMDALTKDVDIKFPDIDLSDPIYQFPGDGTGALYREASSVENKDITSVAKEGDGTFDALMAGIAEHLDKQYKLNRITGDDYSKVYIALTEAAMTNAVQFVLQKDTTKWAAINAQLNAITARVLLETEKTKLATFHIEALDAKTKYALGKSQLAISGIEHCSAQYTYENILPKESLMAQMQIDGQDIENRTKGYNLSTILPAQYAGIELDNDTKDYNLKSILPVTYNTALYNLTEILPLEKSMLTKQIAGVEHDNSIKLFNIGSLLPTQHLLLQEQVVGVTRDNSIKEFTLESMLPAQLELVKEQTEVQVAQTLDVRSDGAPVNGTLGKQKELYTQQIDSYKRNAETSAAKLFLDSWITQKTLDEGLMPPVALDNASVNTVMNAIKSANNIG